MEELTLGVVGGLLGLLVKRSGAKDKVGVEGHGVDPVSVLGKGANELSL